MKYTYYLQNLNLDFKEELLQKISAIDGVKVADIIVADSSVKLEYDIKDTFSEYDIFVVVDGYLQEYNVDVSFEEVKAKKQETQNANVTEQDDIKQTQAEVTEEESQEEAKTKKKGKLAKIPDFTIRLTEIVFAVIMFLLVGRQNWLIKAFCLVLASYEIFYDTICDFIKKRFADNFVVAIAVIFLSLINMVEIAFILAIGFGLLKVINMIILGIFKRKNAALCYLDNFNLTDGGEKTLEELKIGDKVSLQGKIYLKCVVVDGEAEVKNASGETIKAVPGQELVYGDEILNKQILDVEIIEDFQSSSLKEIKEKQQKIEDIISSKKPTKKQNIICISLAIAGFLYALIKPLFVDESYIYTLQIDSFKAIIIVALACPLVDFWKTVRDELLLFKLTKNVQIYNYELLQDLTNIKSYVYSEQTFLNNQQVNEFAYGMIREVKDLGVEKQIAVASSQTLNDTCQQLKLKNRINSTSGEEFDNAINNSLYFNQAEATFNGEKVFAYNSQDIRAIPKTLRVVKRSKLLAKLTTILGVATQSIFAILALSGLVSLSWCFVGVLILSGLLGVMQLFELVEL